MSKIILPSSVPTTAICDAPVTKATDGWTKSGLFFTSTSSGNAAAQLFQGNSVMQYMTCIGPKHFMQFYSQSIRSRACFHTAYCYLRAIKCVRYWQKNNLANFQNSAGKKYQGFIQSLTVFTVTSAIKKQFCCLIVFDLMKFIPAQKNYWEITLQVRIKM